MAVRVSVALQTLKEHMIFKVFVNLLSLSIQLALKPQPKFSLYTPAKILCIQLELKTPAKILSIQLALKTLTKILCIQLALKPQANILCIQLALKPPVKIVYTTSITTPSQNYITLITVIGIQIINHM